MRPTCGKLPPDGRAGAAPRAPRSAADASSPPHPKPRFAAPKRTSLRSDNFPPRLADARREAAGPTPNWRAQRGPPGPLRHEKRAGRGPAPNWRAQRGPLAAARRAYPLKQGVPGPGTETPPRIGLNRRSGETAARGFSAVSASEAGVRGGVSRGSPGAGRLTGPPAGPRLAA